VDVEDDAHDASHLRHLGEEPQVAAHVKAAAAAGLRHDQAPESVLAELGEPVRGREMAGPLNLVHKRLDLAPQEVEDTLAVGLVAGIALDFHGSVLSSRRCAAIISWEARGVVVACMGG
jgi:hypothetical protein